MRAGMTNLRAKGMATALIAALGVLLAGCVGQTGTTSELSGHIVVTGSTALQPLATEAAKLFQQQHPQVQVEVTGGGSGHGLDAVTGHQADIGDSDVYADPALYPDPELTDHLVCVIPFTMIVSPEVTNVSSLTKQQIIDIFSTGKITNWKDVGGPDLAITPVVRPKSSGTRTTFRKYILGGRDEKGKLLQTDSSQTVRDTVAHTPGATGYLALSVLDASVRAIGIDGQNASPASIEGGKYDYWGYEHMYTIGPGDGALGAFLDFMTTTPIQQLAQQLSYIPIAQMKLPSLGSTQSGTSASVPTERWISKSEETVHELS